MEQRPKDPQVKFRNTIRGFDKVKNPLNPEGGERFQLYLSQEEAALFRDALDSMIENPNGVKLDLHVCKRENSKNGNVFDSAYCYVKSVEVPQTQRRATFVQRGTPTASTYSRTAKVNQTLE